MQVALGCLQGHHGSRVSTRFAAMEDFEYDENGIDSEGGIAPIVQSFIDSSNRLGRASGSHDGHESISDEFSEGGDALENNQSTVDARCSAAEGLLIAAVQALTEPTSDKSAAAIQSLLLLLEENPTLAQELQGSISLLKISGKDNIADIFTKPLSFDSFSKFKHTFISK